MTNNEMLQRISILESTVKRLIKIAALSSQVVQEAEFDRDTCKQCGIDITDMSTTCNNTNCLHGLNPNE